MSRYKKEYWYTFNELLAMCEDVGSPSSSYLNSLYDRDRILTFLMDVVVYKRIIGENTEQIIDIYNYFKNYNLTPTDFLAHNDPGSTFNNSIQAQLMTSIKLRYGSEYLVPLSEELDEITYDYNDTKPQALIDWAHKFMNILFMTYSKYYNILSIYDNQISHLMDGIKTTETSEHSTTRNEDYDTDVDGKNVYNDTPATSEVIATIEANQYASNLSKSTAHTDNVGEVSEEGELSRTTENDGMTIMERIEQIQDKFQLVLKKWTDEFAPLFIEEV